MKLTVVALLLSGCGHAANVLPPAGTATAAAPAGSERETARFVVTVPARSAASGQRKPSYVSPATQSITVSTTGPTTLTQTANLTPTSTGCASSLATTVCTLSLALAPGTYSATVSTYDGTNGTGSLLSAGQNLSFTIVQGQANTIALTLSGIPHALLVAALGSGVQPTGASSFVLSGIFAQKLQVSALDADGNYIVGPGSPTYTITETAGPAYTIANPATATPNTFSLTPASTATSATFTVTAAYGDSTCSQSGAVCTATFTASTHLQYLMVENDTNIKIYAPPYTGTPVTLSGYGGTAGLAGVGQFDASGNLFVSDNAGHDLVEYAPPYTGSPVSIGGGSISDPIGVVVAANGTVFVASFTANAVYAYSPPYSSAVRTTISNGVNGPDMLALDASGNLFVSNFRGNNVTEYAPPYTGAPIATLSGVSNPLQVAVAASGDVFVLPVSGSAVYRFASPYGAPTTITAGISAASAVAAGPSSALFAGQSGSNRINRYVSPFTSVATTISNGVSQPQAFTFDAAGELFSANSNSVTIYAPPYTGTPVTITNGVSNPEDVELSK